AEPAGPGYEWRLVVAEDFDRWGFLPQGWIVNVAGAGAVRIQREGDNRYVEITAGSASAGGHAEAGTPLFDILTRVKGVRVVLSYRGGPGRIDVKDPLGLNPYGETAPLAETAAWRRGAAFLFRSDDPGARYGYSAFFLVVAEAGARLTLAVDDVRVWFYEEV
ncbi:MAG: hypothetical protein JSU81_03305, partial [Candidatus Coatesbacteria bacterium]